MHIMSTEQFLLLQTFFKPSVAPNLLEQVFIRCVCACVCFYGFLKFIDDAHHIIHCKYYCKFNCISFGNFLELLLCVCI